MKRRKFLHGTTASLTLVALGCGDDDAPLADAGADVSIDMSAPDMFTEPADASPDAQDAGDDAAWPMTEFVAPLVIPPLLEPTMEGGRKVFSLTIQTGQTEFHPGRMADTIGYNGALLGPTLRAHRGDDITIAVTNTLDESTTTHWHGAHLPAGADGGPHQIIEPGATWRSEWTVNQNACTNWYHPHEMGKTAEQVYFGMAGLFILEDDEVDALDLPKRYGVDDIPLIIQDRRFLANGQLDYRLRRSDTMHGFSGSEFLVNGVLKPHFEVEAKEIRLRLLNGSNGRFYEFAFGDDSPFKLIAGDNSLLGAPLEMTGIQMSPGERNELVIDLTGRLGETLYLIDALTDENLLEIRVAREPELTTSVPDTLITLDAIPDVSFVEPRPFVLSMAGPGSFLINGVAMRMDVINETVERDEVMVWQVRNASPMLHNFHMHATHFRVLSRTSGARASESAYKDTVALAAGETVQLLVQHIDYTDPVAPYMYHCHILEHEDRGMMGQFVVVDP